MVSRSGCTLMYVNVFFFNRSFLVWCHRFERSDLRSVSYTLTVVHRASFISHTRYLWPRRWWPLTRVIKRKNPKSNTYDESIRALGSASYEFTVYPVAFSILIEPLTVLHSFHLLPVPISTATYHMPLNDLIIPYLTYHCYHSIYIPPIPWQSLFEVEYATM